jgi:glycosyltransferase involved in cell wall biosynthesis
VSFEQFGYHTDTLEYCRHLRDSYTITYLCLDTRLPRRKLRGVDVLYCHRRPFGKVEVGLLLEASEAISKLRPDVVFLRRTKFSFLLRLRHPRTPTVFDIRSGSVETNAFRREYENFLLRFNSWFFRHITVISDGLARRLRLPRRARVLPLAADRQPQLTTASRDELRLVCIGTFKNRRIERTVDALGRFLAAADAGIPVRYSIVGFGTDAERNSIWKAVVDHNLEKCVEVLDRLGHESVPAFLAEHNVGVAFTPQVPWFEHQPSTKIYEYLHSGLLCIATDNAANRELISENNGVLVGDTADAFAKGLDLVLELLPRWSPQTVADGVQENTWERVVIDDLAPLLETVQR